MQDEEEGFLVDKLANNPLGEEEEGNSPHAMQMEEQIDFENVMKPF
jgi:hypothetical protein